MKLREAVPRASGCQLGASYRRNPIGRRRIRPIGRLASRRPRLRVHYRGCIERCGRPHCPRDAHLGLPRMVGDGAAEFRSSRRDGAEGSAGIKVRAPLIALTHKQAPGSAPLIDFGGRPPVASSANEGPSVAALEPALRSALRFRRGTGVAPARGHRRLRIDQRRSSRRHRRAKARARSDRRRAA